jgi:hypothetical protein
VLLAETIMATITTVLDTALPASVFRGRVDPLEDSQLPAVGIFQGGEDPLGEQGRMNVGFMDQHLEVRTEVAAKSTSETIETELNELRRLVHVVMMAEDALGLAYVIDIIPAGVDEPTIDGTTDQYTGTMVLNWIVYYRHNQADAGLAP